MNLIDLINTNKEQATTDISTMLRNRVFQYLDNYTLESEEKEIDEAIKSTLNSFDARKVREEKAKLLDAKKKANINGNSPASLQTRILDKQMKIRGIANEELDNYKLESDESLFDKIGRKLKVKTTIGTPDHKNAPDWATHIGTTPEGRHHWLSNDTPVETNNSDKYFPNARKSEFTGYESKNANAKVQKLNKTN